jgi:hypothetical protein
MIALINFTNKETNISSTVEIHADNVDNFWAIHSALKTHPEYTNVGMRIERERGRGFHAVVA